MNTITTNFSYTTLGPNGLGPLSWSLGTPTSFWDGAEWRRWGNLGAALVAAPAEYRPLMAKRLCPLRAFYGFISMSSYGYRETFTSVYLVMSPLILGPAPMAKALM